MPTLRRSLPLALTIAVHMLLAAGFYLALRHSPPNSRSGPQSVLLMIPARPVPPAEAKPAARAVQRAAPQTPSPRPLPRQGAAIEAPPASEATMAAAPPEAPFGAVDIMARAKRDAGKIDRELRGAAPLAPLSADAPRARFERTMATAWIDRSKWVTEDRYVSPDGVVITRLTRNGGTECYMSGTVNFVPGILHDSARPRTVNCPPADSGWSRR